MIVLSDIHVHKSMLFVDSFPFVVVTVNLISLYLQPFCTFAQDVQLCATVFKVEMYV